MNYQVYGPFYSPQVESETKGDQLRVFWDELEEMYPGLPRAVGIYIFSTKHGDSYTPWYVGKTNAQLGFRGEVFQQHKLNHYISARQLKRGTPMLHLIAKHEPNRGNFCQASDVSGRQIDELETLFIAMALRANPDVKNSKKTWFNKNCHVPGILGEPLIGRPNAAVVSLRNALCL